MTTDPMMVLLHANVRAGEIRSEAAGGVTPPASGVLVGAPSHSGAFLLQALDEQRWELRPKAAALEPGVGLAARLVEVAEDGVGLDDLHRSVSLPQIVAVLEMLEAADLVVMESETR